MLQRILLPIALLTCFSCAGATRNKSLGDIERGIETEWSPTIVDPADFYQVQFLTYRLAPIRLYYIRLDSLSEERLTCEARARTCRAFLPRAITVFATPIRDRRLWASPGTDVCPILTIRRNGAELRVYLERPLPDWCLYRLGPRIPGALSSLLDPIGMGQVGD